LSSRNGSRQKILKKTVTLSEIRQILATGNIRLTKSLGQNFLHDGNQLRRLVAAAELRAGDRVLEIGPGLGPLTEMLIAQPVEVLAIEIDNRLYDFLNARFHQAKNLRLLRADALDYFRKEKPDFQDWKLVANLPYSVASRILVQSVPCGWWRRCNWRWRNASWPSRAARITGC
jgi:16S rRNA (adenine1518-N6/adenine1519-N6)-dimethyltransferase